VLRSSGSKHEPCRARTRREQRKISRYIERASPSAGQLSARFGRRSGVRTAVLETDGVCPTGRARIPALFLASACLAQTLLWPRRDDSDHETHRQQRRSCLLS
jgi:hypothetical protein